MESNHVIDKVVRILLFYIYLKVFIKNYECLLSWCTVDIFVILELLLNTIASTFLKTYESVVGTRH